MENELQASSIVPLKWTGYGVDGDLIIIYPTPYFIYLRGTIMLF